MFASKKILDLALAGKRYVGIPARAWKDGKKTCVQLEQLKGGGG